MLPALRRAAAAMSPAVAAAALSRGALAFSTACASSAGRGAQRLGSAQATPPLWRASGGLPRSPPRSPGAAVAGFAAQAGSRSGQQAAQAAGAYTYEPMAPGGGGGASVGGAEPAVVEEIDFDPALTNSGARPAGVGVGEVGGLGSARWQSPHGGACAGHDTQALLPSCSPAPPPTHTQPTLHPHPRSLPVWHRGTQAGPPLLRVGQQAGDVWAGGHHEQARP